MSLVCGETVRIEALRMQQLPYVFQRLPLNVHGNLPLSQVDIFSALYSHTVQHLGFMKPHLHLQTLLQCTPHVVQYSICQLILSSTM